MLQQVVFSQVECTPDGVVQVRLRKQLVNAEGLEVAGEYHRFIVEPDESHEAAHARVDAHLQHLGWVAPGDEVKARVARICQAEHTPDVVERYKHKKKAAAQASKDHVAG